MNFYQWNVDQVKGNLVGVIRVRAVEVLLLSQFAIVARTEVDLTRPALSEFSSWFWVISDIHSIVYEVEPPLIDNLYLSTTATSLKRQLWYVQADSPYIGSCLYLSTTATATKECPNRQNKLSTKVSSFRDWQLSREWTGNLISVTRRWSLEASLSISFLIKCRVCTVLF